MLKETTISKIASMLKIDPAKFKEAISHKEEKDVEIDEKLQVFDDASITARDRNKYNEGKTAGQEMLVKEIKRKHSVEVEGDDVENIIEAIVTKTKAAASGKPDEKVTELEKQVNHWKAQHQEATNKLTETQRQISEANFDRELLGYFPKNRDGKFQDDEYLTIVKRGLQIQEVDGKKVVIKDGKEVRNDKTFEPVAMKDVIESLFNERKWIADEGGQGGQGQGRPAGAGGGNSQPGAGTSKFTKMSEVNKYLSDNGMDPKGDKGQAFIMAAVKENPSIDFQS